MSWQKSMGDYVLHLYSSWETPGIILTPCCTYWPIVKSNRMVPRHTAETPSGRSAWNLEKRVLHIWTGNSCWLQPTSKKMQVGSVVEDWTPKASHLRQNQTQLHVDWYRTADLIIMFNGIKTCKVNKMEMVLKQIPQLFCHELAITCQSI